MTGSDEVEGRSRGFLSQLFSVSLCWWPRGMRVNSISRLQTIHSGEIPFIMRGERRRHRWDEPGVQDGAGHHPDIQDRCRKRMRRRLRALESPNSSEVRGVKTSIANSSRGCGSPNRHSPRGKVGATDDYMVTQRG